MWLSTVKHGVSHDFKFHAGHNQRGHGSAGPIGVGRGKKFAVHRVNGRHVHHVGHVNQNLRHISQRAASGLQSHAQIGKRQPRLVFDGAGINGAVW